MLQSGNGSRRKGASCTGRMIGWWSAYRTLWAALVVFAGMMSAEAQGPGASEKPALPSASDSLKAYQALDGWIRAWAVPGEAQRLDPAGARGTLVTLRLGGLVLGRGSRMSEDGLSLWRAAREAWTEADRGMPFERDALRESNVADASRRVQIEVQFAGELTPLLGETFEVAAASLSPGLDGVAARIGERTEGMFPGVALATGAGPGEALRVAVGRLGLPPVELGKLIGSHGVVVYRFGVRSLAQLAPGGAPIFTYRGGRIVGLGEVTAAGLRAAAGAIAGNIMSHGWPGEEPHGLLGDYLPLEDRYEPLIAPPVGQALAAFALIRYATAPGIPEGEAARLLRFAGEIVERLTIVTRDEADPLASAVDAGMWLIARRALEEASPGVGEGSRPEFRGQAVARVRATFDGAGGGWTASAPGTGRGVLACALAYESRRPEAGSLGDEARRAVRAVYRETDRAGLVAELPWLPWADLALALVPNDLPSATALRELRETTWTFQVTERDAGAEFADMTGGILFTRTRNTLPTWHSLRPLAFFASALGDSRLTDEGEVREQALALRRSLRFLLQLMVDDSNVWLFRDRGRCFGGVRSALWDQTCGLEAASLALLTVSETLRSTAARSTAKPVEERPEPAGGG